MGIAHQEMVLISTVMVGGAHPTIKNLMTFLLMADFVLEVRKIILFIKKYDNKSELIL